MLLSIQLVVLLHQRSVWHSKVCTADVLAELSAARSWDEIELLLEASVLPIWDRIGEELVERLRATASPGARAALVEIDARRQLGLLNVFESHELVEASLGYLAQPGAFEHEWAWYGICHGNLAPEERWDLVIELVELSPDDEESFWLLGDGPIASLEMDQDLLKKLEREERRSSRFASIRRIVLDRLHGA